MFSVKGAFACMGITTKNGHAATSKRTGDRADGKGGWGTRGENEIIVHFFFLLQKISV